MDRFICIHGHFYQPPRENPWLETVDYQESAYPYHDWNERITSECYGPNAAARVMDGENRIVDIVNNYASISFNVGPTLLSWLELHAPDTYQAILDADRESQRRFSGHGAAIAQAYNHMILPLANERDRYTQVRWGLKDFEYRFGRPAEGMWLPETAVDLGTLETLSQLGIRFTILSPYQARRVRKIGTDQWVDVQGGEIDPTMPYRQLLPSGRTIDLFFYDGPISRAVAFERLLASGERFTHRLMEGFSNDREGPQLVHIATDGESYGHHHRWGEMALADTLRRIETQGLARVTIYAEHLDLHPPTHEVEVLENTSWSCFHGIERWRSDCGCNSGGRSWNQAWRRPLRAALGTLRDAVAPMYESAAGQLLNDPWAARDDYGEVVLHRSAENVERFLARHATHELTPREITTALELLEMQRHAMLMYTSCGWFFDEISGIETVQILQYAGRVVQLAERAFGQNVEQRFRQRLRAAKSNLAEHVDGAEIYTKFVKPAVVNTLQVGAHYAIDLLFPNGHSPNGRQPFRFELLDSARCEQAGSKLVVGRARVTSDTTWDSKTISFGALRFGDHNLSAAVRESNGMDDYASLATEVVGAFESADLAHVIRLLDKHFGGATYSFKSLFRDEQRRILGPMLDQATEDTESACAQVYERHAPLLAFLEGIQVPLPRPLKGLAELVLNVELRRALERPSLDVPRISSLLDDVRHAGGALDEELLAHLAEGSVHRCLDRLKADPTDPSVIESVSEAVRVAQLLPFGVNLWRAQNAYWSILNAWHPPASAPPRGGERDGGTWERSFMELGSLLGIRVPG